jgi:hypothetical protein
MTVAMAPAPSEELRTTLPHTLSEVGLLLREDDSLLRQTFFGIVKHHHPTLADKIDTIYALSLAWCRTESDRDFQQLEKCLAELNPDELILVRGRAPRSRCACARARHWWQIAFQYMLGQRRMVPSQRTWLRGCAR